MPQESTSKNMHSNSQPHDAGAPPPSHQPNCVPTNSEGNNDQQAQKCNCYRPPKAHEKWVIVWAAVTAVVTLCSVIVAFLQWRSMDGQVEEMRRQFRVDQRPYVMPANWKPYLLEPGRPIHVRVSWVNYGKSPAIKVRGRGAILFGPNAMEQVDRWFEVNEQIALAGSPETIVPPGAPADWSDAQVTTYKTKESVTQEGLDAWSAGTYYLIIVGRSEYFDGAGNRYWTDSCLFYTPSGDVLEHCATHYKIH